MTRRLSFQVAQASREHAEAEPDILELTWTDLAGEAKVEEFKCRPAMIPPMLLMQIPNMEIDMNSVALIRTFKAALGDEYDRFHEFVTSPEHIVEAEELANIVYGLFEASTGRPIEPSSP